MVNNAKDISLEGFQQRIQNKDYFDSITKYWKKHTKDVIKEYMLEHNLSFTTTLKYENNIPVNEVKKMALELKKRKNEFNLTDEQYQLLNQIINDKYSVGSFSGMIFNARVSSGKSTEELIKTALNVRIQANKMLD